MSLVDTNDPLLTADEFSDAKSVSTTISECKFLQPDFAAQNFMSSSRVSEQEKLLIVQYIDNLKYHDKRDMALAELSKRREHFPELAPYIWHSVGTIAALL